MSRVPKNLHSHRAVSLLLHSHRFSSLSFVAAFSLIVSSVVRVRADQPHPVNELRPAGPVSGTLFIGGGGVLPAPVVDRYFELV